MRRWEKSCRILQRGPPRWKGQESAEIQTVKKIGRKDTQGLERSLGSEVVSNFKETVGWRICLSETHGDCNSMQTIFES